MLVTGFLVSGLDEQESVLQVLFHSDEGDAQSELSQMLLEAAHSYFPPYHTGFMRSLGQITPQVLEIIE